MKRGKAVAGARAFPFYDGNGNITVYANAAGEYQATYSYDGFLNATSGMATSGSYRYQASTKSWNPALGLLEYQFRAYSPELGRWIQEDPIEEAGGKNLYGFVRNNAVNNTDKLGFIVIVERTQGKYARACLGAASDTIDDLADEINLKSNEWSMWLTEMDGSSVDNVKRFHWYQIPNTIIAYWGGDVGLLGKAYVRWDVDTTSFFYNVATYDVTRNSYKEYQSLLEDASKQKSLHGTRFFGHGNSSGLAAEFGLKGFEPTYVWLLSYSTLKLKYAPAFAEINACQSNAGRSAFLYPKRWRGYNGTLVPFFTWNWDL